MKRKSEWIVTNDETLKARRCTVIVTKQASSSEEEEQEEKEISTCNHMFIVESDEKSEEEDIQEAPSSLEEGNRITIDELKEVNIGTIEDPRPIFINASLTSVEEKSYLDLLTRYRDVFAWTYKEIPRLDPKVAVHHLAVKKGVRPIKQAQRRLHPNLIPQIEAEVNKLIEIHMDPKDEELTTFQTPKGIYCYKVMPFGLKNVGATYQRAMQKIFDDMLHRNVECYVDDLVVKFKKRVDHLEDLRQVFERLRQYQLRMNPLKCAFGVSSRKVLGFIVRHHGIEIDQSKIDAIMKMPEPSNLHELKSLQGRLAYIRRFISNLTGRCQPFSRLMKKDMPFVWDESCSNAFKSIKFYLLRPPILRAPTLGRPLILYIATQERSLGALLAQQNDEGKENALYYLSRTLNGIELNYSPIEKTCLALIAKWEIGKMDFFVIRVRHHIYPQKAVKGQALADFLADHPIPDDWKFSEDLLDEYVLCIEIPRPWKLYFDGAARQDGAGAGVIFITPEGEVLPYAFTLIENCSNNVAEYQALIIGLEMAVDMQITQLKVFGDSKLVINQVLTLYEVKKLELLPYVNYVKKLLKWFDKTSIEHVPRKKNRQVDSLANLASAIASPNTELKVHLCKRWIIPPITLSEEVDIESNVVSVLEVGKEDWR
ncbi:PREDICTED: uncharacterized protein LOC108663676 [Theobroma cacao]|uniref:Uncharacterized protein LOC108663676 n=1 Tax=Theobroma cacao TaxID=3641 RepID=A0AB32WXQ0_THECC|nr:PREDICTED: uncharacterized protein LOC108663676 [Theobroma cacao]